MQTICCVCSLFLFVFRSIFAVIARCFLLFFWHCSDQRATVSAAEKGYAAVFSLHYHPHQRPAPPYRRFTRCFPDLESMNLNNLMLIPLPCARSTLRQLSL
jgi:hypothetical protein